MKSPQSSHLGQYLRLLRESRGYENIHEYVRKYKLPFSYVYYTELETGKRRIGLQACQSLCQALDANVPSFFYHMLQDVLPDGVKEEFLARIPLDEVFDAHDQENKEQQIKDAYRKQLRARLNLDTCVMSEEAETYFVENTQLMPLLEAIYCVPSMTDKELEEIAQQIGITASISEIIANLEQFGIIKCTEGKKGTRTITRAYDLIGFRDQRIVARRVRTETELTLSAAPSPQIGGPDDSSCFYDVVGLTKEQQDEFIASLADLCAEMNAYHLQDIGTNSGPPTLIATVFSPACEYDLAYCQDKTKSPAS